VTPDGWPPACNECLFVTKLQRVVQGLLRANRHVEATPKFNRRVGERKRSRLAIAEANFGKRRTPEGAQ
jgi:hypothetical protein